MCYKAQIFLVLGFCAFFIDCVNVSVQDMKASPKIVGGEIVTNRAELAYQVSIRVNGRHLCGGALIDNHHVLTAAHCCYYRSKSKLREIYASATLTIVLGDLKLQPPSDTTVYKTVDKIITHKEYNAKNFMNDIAVLRISEPFTNWTDYIRPISIAEMQPKAGTSCVVSGWGRTKPGGNLSNDLRRVSVAVLSEKQCKRSYPANIRPGMMCAGFLKGGKDACQGDSGGPLVSSTTSNDILIGIVSWGFGCAKPNYPGVYTDVSYYRKWIISATNKSTKGSFLQYLIIMCISIIKLM